MAAYVSLVTIAVAILSTGHAPEIVDTPGCEDNDPSTACCPLENYIDWLNPDAWKDCLEPDGLPLPEVELL